MAAMKVVRFVVRQQAGTSVGAPVREAKVGDVVTLSHLVRVLVDGEVRDQYAPLAEVEIIDIVDRP